MNFERPVDSDIERLIDRLCDKCLFADGEELDNLTKSIARLRASLNPVVKIDR